MNDPYPSPPGISKEGIDSPKEIFYIGSREYRIRRLPEIKDFGTEPSGAGGKEK
jgi:hypothetical protein